MVMSSEMKRLRLEAGDDPEKLREVLRAEEFETILNRLSPKDQKIISAVIQTLAGVCPLCGHKV